MPGTPEHPAIEPDGDSDQPRDWRAEMYAALYGPDGHPGLSKDDLDEDKCRWALENADDIKQLADHFRRAATDGPADDTKDYGTEPYVSVDADRCPDCDTLIIWHLGKPICPTCDE